MVQFGFIEKGLYAVIFDFAGMAKNLARVLSHKSLREIFYSYAWMIVLLFATKLCWYNHTWGWNSWMGGVGHEGACLHSQVFRSVRTYPCPHLHDNLPNMEFCEDVLWVARRDKCFLCYCPIFGDHSSRGWRHACSCPPFARASQSRRTGRLGEPVATSKQATNLLNL